jgi:hypothetical protein
MLLKKVIPPMLCLVILLPSLNRLGIIIDFKLHQEFIAAVLCIEKDTPSSTCNGKCHLVKELEKAEEPAQQLPNSRQQKLEVLFINGCSYSSKALQAHNWYLKRKLAYLESLKSLSLINEIFHPPSQLTA